MKTRTILAAVSAAALMPNLASAAWSETVYTYQSNGVEWRFLIDEDAHTACLGTNPNTGSEASTTYYASSAELSGKVILPEAFTINGVSYRVTTIGNRAFNNSKSSGNLKSLTFPSGVGIVRDAVFYNYSSIESVCYKGPVTVAAGEQESVVLGGAGVVAKSTASAAIKTVFVGPRLQKANYAIEFKKSSGCTYFFPRSGGDWVTTTSVLGTNPNVIIYGPEEELDFKMGETTLTATVRTANALTNVLNHVAIFKENFGLDTKINVTNNIEVAADLITAENMQYATFNSLMLKVTTQAQLTSILAVIPASVPFVIDASDAQEELTVPQGREVYVRVSGEGRNGKYRPKVNGLIISFF